MSVQKYNTAQRILLYLRDYQNLYNTDIPAKFVMESTPLNQSIITAMKIVPQFKAKNKLQIVNTVFLTDGDSDSMYSINELSNRVSFGGKATQVIYRDPINHRDFKCDNGLDKTAALVKTLKARTGSNNIGFFLIPWKASRSDLSGFFPNKDLDKAINELKTKGLAVCKSSGYDEYYIIQCDDRIVVKNDTLDIGPRKTSSSMAAMFGDYMKKKSFNRVLLERFITQIS